MRHATGIIPIVFSVVTDPVGQGFVSSLSQPGGNITGFATNELALPTKRLELLKKIAPAIARVVVLYNAPQPNIAAFAETQAAAAALGVVVLSTPLRSLDEVDRVLRRRGEITESSGSTGVMDSPVWG
jgi:putative ABC transport system substrate-binding protein